MRLRRKLANLAEELKRTDNSPADKVLRIAQRATLGLEPGVSIKRLMIVEVKVAPKQFRGMRDVVVRRGTDRDVDALCSLEDSDRSRILAWLGRGDMVYVAELDGEVLCATWFHPGPTPFDGDRTQCVDWAIDAQTYWSFKGASRPDVRESGLFVKLFQEALRDVFEVHGASRVQGYIYDDNNQSLLMHERMGFQVLGSFLSVAIGRVKWVRWEGGGKHRQWLLPRASSTALSLPPV